MAAKGDVAARVQAEIDAVDPDALSGSALDQLRRRCQAAFDEALAERGRAASSFHLVVHCDPLVGPMALVSGPGGKSWPLPAFQAWLDAN